mmetsp:Transcript_13118/g.49015  ORF Transcript_13118/g.49015 Transcript_13118/m.49015 type:complete len:255 (+) Transcript_13118:2758-3522(+)
MRAFTRALPSLAAFGTFRRRHRPRVVVPGGAVEANSVHGFVQIYLRRQGPASGAEAGRFLLLRLVRPRRQPAHRLVVGPVPVLARLAAAVRPLARALLKRAALRVPRRAALHAHSVHLIHLAVVVLVNTRGAHGVHERRDALVVQRSARLGHGDTLGVNARASVGDRELRVRQPPKRWRLWANRRGAPIRVGAFAVQIHVSRVALFCGSKIRNRVVVRSEFHVSKHQNREPGVRGELLAVVGMRVAEPQFEFVG